MAEIKCISTVQHIKTSDGSFAAVFPVTTMNEVYYNIDGRIKLDDYYKAILSEADCTVTTYDDLVELGVSISPPGINLVNGGTVYVSSTNKKYIIVDDTMIGHIEAFAEIPNSETGSVYPSPNKVAKYDEYGKLHSNLAVAMDDVITYDFLYSDKFVKSTNVREVEDVTGVDATTLNGLPAAQYVTLAQIKTIADVENGTITGLQADKLCDKIPVSCLPAEALQKCVTVASDDERFALTTATVHNGDTVKVTNTLKMYFVTDDTKLNNESGYTEYTVARAATVSWVGITEKPTTLAGYGLNTEDNTINPKYTEKDGVTELTATTNVGLMSDDTLVKIYTTPGRMDINTHGEVFNDYENNTATGNYSHAGGHDSHAISDKSFVHGEGLKSNTVNQTVVGAYNDTEATDKLFVVGNGTDDENRSNVLEVGGGTTRINENLTVSGKLDARLTMNSLHMDINDMSAVDIQYITGIGMAPILFRTGDSFTTPYGDDRQIRFEITEFMRSLESSNSAYWAEYDVNMLSDVVDFAPINRVDAFLYVKDGQSLPAGTYWVSDERLFSNSIYNSSILTGSDYPTRYTGTKYYSFTLDKPLTANQVLVYTEIYGNSDIYFSAYDVDKTTLIDRYVLTEEATKPTDYTEITSNDSSYKINNFHIAYNYNKLHKDSEYKVTYAIRSSDICNFINGVPNADIKYVDDLDTDFAIEWHGEKNGKLSLPSVRSNTFKDLIGAVPFSKLDVTSTATTTFGNLTYYPVFDTNVEESDIKILPHMWVNFKIEARIHEK